MLSPCVNKGVSGPLSDAELVGIYRATIGPLYRYVSRRVGGDVSLAEDLVQDGWMRAIGHWPASGVPREPLACLIRAAALPEVRVKSSVKRTNHRAGR